MANKEITFISDIPHLLAQWHPTKNGDMLPYTITKGSTTKVWWICEKGHEWQTSPNNRYLKRSSCPYCSGRKVIPGETDLATVNPALAKEWHPTLNGTLAPSDVTRASRKKAWWRCEKGHEWQANVFDRTVNGTGCPYCSGRKAFPGETDLATINPVVAQEWHPTRNGSLDPTDVTAFSRKKVWWICDQGHEWQASIKNRSYGSGCPRCASIKKGELMKYKASLSLSETDNGNATEKNKKVFVSDIPQLLAQWHPTKNEYLLPSAVTKASNKKVWWLCEKGHEWQSTVNNRYYRQSGCPECAKDKIWEVRRRNAAIKK